MRFKKLVLGAVSLAVGALSLGVVVLAASGRPVGPPVGQPPDPPRSAPPKVPTAPPDAAASVRSVREQEAWIDRVDSLWLKADYTEERTPAGIAKARRELQEQFPGFVGDAHPNLQPRGEGQTELAFDRKRLRAWNRYSWGIEDTRVWDGKRYLGGSVDAKNPRTNGFLIAPKPGGDLNTSLSFFASFQAGPHPYWWISTKDQTFNAQLSAKPEDFVAVGRDRFDETECEVFCAWGSWDRFYIADGRLRGIKSGCQTRPDLVARQVTFLRREGYDIGDVKDFFEGLTPEKRREIDRKQATQMLTLTDPIIEQGMEDYREVAPGCWLPFRQTSRILIIDEAGRNTVDLSRTLKITEAHVNTDLPATLFEVPIVEGAQVIDQTSNPPVTYHQKASFTADEWAEIIAQGKKQAQRDSRREQAQAALIGRPAPEFPTEGTWLQGPPIRWADLAGQVVVLDFWAEWCGPCRNDLPVLSGVHRNRDSNGLTVIGVHPPGSEPAAIDKMFHDFRMDYPTCVDVAPPAGVTSWGAMFERYGVDRVPHAVLVDRQGKIVATGDVNDILLKGFELARPAR